MASVDLGDVRQLDGVHIKLTGSSRRTQRTKGSFGLRVLLALRGEGFHSHNLHEGIAQPVEQPVAREKDDDGRHAERQQPLPVAERAGEKEDLLIRNHQVRERVEVEQRLVGPDLRLVIEIDDGRREEPQH